MVQVKYGVLDIETAGEPFHGKLLCIGWRDTAYTPETPGWDDMLAELADPNIGKVVFTKYDHRWLRLAGYDVRGPIVDVQAMAWAVNERTPLDLEWCARKYCGIIMDKRINQSGGVVYFECDDGTKVPIDSAPIEQMCAYNERDLEATERLMRELKRLLGFDDLAEYFERDVMPFTEVLLDMEVRGIPVDVEAAARLKASLENDIERLTDKLYVTAGLPPDFNVNSNKQLASLLFERTFKHKESVRITPEERDELKAFFDVWGSFGVLPDGLIVERVGRDYAHGYRELKGFGWRSFGTTASGAPATDAKGLQIAYGTDPWVQTYIEMAQKRTIVNVFLKTIEEQSHEGRLYGRFNQTGTKTGRLSSSGPNLQNIPSRGALGRQVRQLFRPELGSWFVHGDYSQLEPRLMAHFSGDPMLRRIYEDGLDIYLATGAEIFGCSLEEAKQYRNPMKVYILALGYGSGARTLKRQLAEFGHSFALSEVEDTLSRLKKVYDVFFEWKEDVIATAQNEGYVETLAGHRRRFGGQVSSWKAEGADERQAVNAVIQGSAADIVARAMMNVSAMPGLELLAQVHDELLIQTFDRDAVDLAAIQTACEQGHGFDLAVPLVFEPHIIPTWAEGKD